MNDAEMRKRFVFVSNMSDAPWGGSEELWAGAALRLASSGKSVAASVHGWTPPHPKIEQLSRAGVAIQARRLKSSLLQRAWLRIARSAQTSSDQEIIKFLAASSPACVVMSCTPFWLSLMEYCVKQHVPFVTISQANLESLWPDDVTASTYRRLLPAARRCYFVSSANRRLLENQIGCSLSNAEVVWNPFNVRRDVSLPWPTLTENGELRLASVARLHPPSKGQDLLLEALADSKWRGRKWHLTLYGEGPMRDTINRMVCRFGIQDHVSIAGFINSIETVWAENHALVMPSRYEGMPLAMVEAMLCARPVLATDVASHSEVVIEGVTGFLAEATTAQSVGNALERLWTNRLMLKKMGETATQMIRNRLPPDPVGFFANELTSLFEQARCAG